MKPSATLTRLKSEAALRETQLVIGVVAVGVIFWRLQNATTAICCGDFDGYYHIKWTQLLWDSLKTHHTIPSFRWLPLTILNSKQYVDHHFLFHVFQIPFATFKDPRVGAKFASALFGSLAVVSCYWLLIRYRIRYVLVWLVALLACSAPFLFRLNMAKAPPFAIIFLVISIYFLFQRKYWLLLPIGFLFTETYDVFPLLLLAVAGWVLVIGWTERRFEWRPLVWLLPGILAGLVINPYFPQNLHLYYEHARLKLTLEGFNTKVGGEWYPYDSWEFLGNSLVACIAMVVGYIALDPADRERSHRSFFFAFLSTALLIMIARWKRMAEYWPPFAVMFAAFSLQPWLEGARSAVTRLPTDVIEELEPFLDRFTVVKTTDDDGLREWLKRIGFAFVSLLLCVVLFFNLRAVRKEIGQSESHEYFHRGAEWLVQHVPAGHIIFNTDWDDFPRLFYYDSVHSYVSGLDPSYLYERDPDLSRLYERITLGQENDPGPLIRDRFGATYVFSDNEHNDFFDKARESGWFEIVYEDEECTIMRIRDQKQSSVEEKDDFPTGVVIGNENRP
jgi:hypothetical protein